jgi:hypothetical protein
MHRLLRLAYWDEGYRLAADAQVERHQLHSWRVDDPWRVMRMRMSGAELAPGGNRWSGPALALILPAMATLAPGDRFRLWPAVWPLVRMLVLSALPVPDLLSRRKVRRAARDLARGCDPWPGMAASGDDAARLALHHLLYLQRATHRAVRSRQDEAATMLARVMIETYITGMYCLYEPGAVAKLQNGQLKMLRPMLEFLREDGGVLSGVPGDVLDECIRRLDAGTPADGPKVWVMAEKVDTATGSTIAISLYNRLARRPRSATSAVTAGPPGGRHGSGADGHSRGSPTPAWAVSPISWPTGKAGRGGTPRGMPPGTPIGTMSGPSLPWPPSASAASAAACGSARHGRPPRPSRGSASSAITYSPARTPTTRRPAPRGSAPSCRTSWQSQGWMSPRTPWTPSSTTWLKRSWPRPSRRPPRTEEGR